MCGHELARSVRTAAMRYRERLKERVGPVPAEEESCKGQSIELNLDEKALPELSNYIPPFVSHFQCSKPLITALTQLDLFQLSKALGAISHCFKGLATLRPLNPTLKHKYHLLRPAC
jgi:hypothetical protein